MDDAELRELQDAARRRGLTVAEWVRQALRSARQQEPLGDLDAKLSVVRSALRYSFPAPEIPQMLREIEQGYVGEDQA